MKILIICGYNLHLQYFGPLAAPIANFDDDKNKIKRHQTSPST